MTSRNVCATMKYKTLWTFTHTTPKLMLCFSEFCWAIADQKPAQSALTLEGTKPVGPLFEKDGLWSSALVIQSELPGPGVSFWNKTYVLAFMFLICSREYQFSYVKVPYQKELWSEPLGLSEKPATGSWFVITSLWYFVGMEDAPE